MTPLRSIRQKSILFLCIALLTCLSSCANSGQPDSTATIQRPVHWATPIDTTFNLYQIDTDLYRSEQAQTLHISQIKALGIRTVISFRAFHSDDTIIQDPQITLIRIPILTWHIQDQHIVAALNAIEEAKRNGAVLIHCQHGADRTGLVSAMYRVVYQGWSKSDALEEMLHGGYGYHSIWTNIPRYLEQVDIEQLRLQLRYPPPEN